MIKFFSRPTAAIRSNFTSPPIGNRRPKGRGAWSVVALIALAFLLALDLPRARAAVTYTWTSSTSGNWSTAANWSGGVPASNNTNTVIFGGTTGYTSTYDLATNPFILNALQFNDTASGVVTLATSTNGIRLGGTTPSFVQNGSSGVSVTAPLFINTNGATLSGTGTGDVSLSALNFTAGNTLALSDAANVSIASLLNTDTAATAKTVTNNITAAGKALTVGTLSLGGTANNTFSFGGSGTTTVTGVISETGSLVGSLTKADGGTLFLHGANTFTGTLQVNNGILDVNSLADSGTGSNGSGSIRLLNAGNATAQFTYLGAGAVTTRAIDIFGTGANTTAIVDSSGTGPLTLGGASVSGSAPKVLQLQGSNTGNNTLADVVSDGAGSIAVTKAGAGTWVLAAENTYSGSTTVNAGTLKLTSAVSSNNIPTSPIITVNSGAKLDVTGFAGGFSLAANQSLRGSGTVAGLLNVIAGGNLTPGNGVGTLTSDAQKWGGGGSFGFDIADASGDPQIAAGINWNDVVANGAISISSTAAAPFVVKLTSLSATVPGDAANFNPSQNYTWTIASATGGIVGFDPSKFTLDPSGFTNATNGQFGLVTSGNNLELTYVTAATPEPATATGLIVLASTVMRRRKRTAV